MKLTKQDIFAFVKALLIIALPIILQQFFLNIASLLDTLMVGRLEQADASVSGVYVANEIIFVINLIIFGATEGGSVFFCQYFGVNDEKNMRKCFLFKIYFSVILAIFCIVIANVFAKPLVNLFVTAEENVTIAIGYLKLLSISFVPYAIVNSISTCLRESNHAHIPMITTFAGVFVNFIVNFLFIFGCGFIPKMGATGAAIGTITERYLEMIALIIILMVKKFPFSRNLFHHLSIKPVLLKGLILRSVPLVLNETLWAVGQTMLVYVFTQNNADIATYSLPIATTIFNLVFVVCMGLGQSITISLGSALGQGKKQEAQAKAWICVLVALIVGVILCLLMQALAIPVSSLYTGVSPEAREMGAYLIRIYGVYIIVNALTNALFFIIRSGGQTVVVFLFDSGYAWLIQIPLSFLLLYFTHFEFGVFVPLVYSIDLIKIAIGIILIASGKWVKTLTKNDVAKEIKE